MREWTDVLKARLAGLRLAPAREAEIIEELSAHLDERVAELTRGGASAAAARRRALDELADHDLLRRNMAPLRQSQQTELPPPGPPASGRGLRDFWMDLRYAFRMLWRQRGFTAAATLTLALGIGANTAIFSLVNATLLQRLPVRDSDRLLMASYGAVGNVMSYPAYVALRDGNEVFDGFIAWGGISASLNADGETDLVAGAIVTGNYFDVLGVSAEQGRLLAPSDDVTVGGHPVAVISHRLWQSRFAGRADIVNHEVRLNGQVFTIVGVTPADFTGAQLGVVRDLYVPMMMQAIMRPPRAGYSGEMNPDLLTNPNSGWLFTLGRLKPGLTADAAAAQLSGVAGNYLRSLNPSARPRQMIVVPANIEDPAQRDQMRSVALLLGGIVGAVLLIACANVANLLLSRAAARRRELAVRLAIGASRWRLVRQMLTESLALALVGGAAGVATAWGLARAFRAAPPPAGALPIVLNFEIDGRVLLFSLALSVATGLVFGLLPAIQASRPKLVPALKEEALAATGEWRRLGLKQLLVVVEVALSLALLATAGLFVRSLQASRAIDAGMDTDHLLSAPLNVNLLRYTTAQGRTFYRQIVDRMARLPGVEAAAVARVAVLNGGSGRTVGITVEGRSPNSQFTSEGGNATAPSQNAINANVVSDDFFRTLGIPLVTGRTFDDRDTPAAPPVVVMNETAAALYFPHDTALGKRVSFSGAHGPWVEVVGIVRNSKYASLNEGPRAIAYLPLSQNHETGVTLYVRTAGSPAALAATTRHEIQALEPNLPVPDIQTMADTVGTSLYAARMGAALLTVFGVLALLLAAIGIYGVLAFSTARRTRELGIRLALGADARRVFGLVLREGLVLVTIGIAIGLGLAFASGRGVRTFLYGVGAHDPLTFVGVTLALALVAMAACAIPARRAMRVDPMVALRTD